MTNLSVNVNKIATLRNSRGNNTPNLEEVTDSIIEFGADGITIHPRPDERHITNADVFSLSPLVKKKVEFNIEGFPSNKFINMVIEAQPDQVTLVPDKDDVLTSLKGWDTIKQKAYLKDVVKEFKNHGIRTSIFVHPELKMIDGAATIGSDRIELFTGIYAQNNSTITRYSACSIHAHNAGLGVNAGHDLNLDNLSAFIAGLPFLDEVSIGHGLISESLFLGLENTINMYKRILV